MPSPTYVALAKNVLTSGQSSITFSAIPGSYTDLIILGSARVDQAGTYYNLWVTVNSVASGYSETYLYGVGTTPGSGRVSSAVRWSNAASANGTGSTANTFSNFELYFPNYAGSTNKVASVTTVVESNGAADNIILPSAELVSTTAAITSITIASASGNIVSGSRFDLYGIKNS